MTEFGAAEDIKGDIYALNKSVQQADKHMQSWIYWQFKYFQDITTCTPVGESLYNEDGSVVQHKLKVLSRSYATAVAGKLSEGFRYDPLTGVFKMKYELLSELPSTAAGDTNAAVTEVYINRELSYPHGAHITVTNANTDEADTHTVISCAHASNTVQIVQSQAVAADAAEGEVEVTITPCSLLVGDCNCR